MTKKERVNYLGALGEKNKNISTQARLNEFNSGRRRSSR